MLRQIVFNCPRLLETSSLGASINLQSVRWRRKPRWLPVAKSKRFRVPPRRAQDPDEKLELLRLHNIYRTQLRSVICYLHKEVDVKRKTSTADHLVLTPEQEEAEFQKCLAINTAWNEKITSEREARLLKEADERKAYVARKLNEASFREGERREKIERLVQLEKERSKSFITLDNLDEAIEHALANAVDYNFSIDLQENMYKGRDARPESAIEKRESIVPPSG